MPRYTNEMYYDLAQLHMAETPALEDSTIDLVPKSQNHGIKIDPIRSLQEPANRVADLRQTLSGILDYQTLLVTIDG